MILKKLNLHNYRCFKNLDIEFDEKLTVLVGDNGAGKTTVLSAAVVALGTFMQSFATVSTTLIRKNDARIERALSGDGDRLAAYPVGIYAEAEFDGRLIRWKRELRTEKGQTTIVDAKEMLDKSKEYNQSLQMQKKEVVLPVILYYGTGRLYDTHREKNAGLFKNENRLNGYIGSLDSTANIKLMNNWFKKKTIERYQRIERGAQADISLDVVFKPMERIFETISKTNNVKIQYSLSQDELVVWYKNGQSEEMCIPISQLSAGYRNTISLIADISYRMVMLNPELGEEVLKKSTGVIMIDEIDQHLHPLWQQRIIGDLQEVFPGVQFIMTTHAPTVIGSVKSMNLRKISEDHIVEGFPEVYGKDNNGILSMVMDSDERPKVIKDKFAAFYGYIDRDDLENAERVLEGLKDLIDPDDPELVSCEIKLDLAGM